MQKKKNLPENQESSSEWQDNIKKQARQEQMKKYGIWGGLIAVCAAGLVALALFANNATQVSTETVDFANLPKQTPSDIVLGNPKAKVIITEYLDYQCPACASVNLTLDKILNDYDGRVKVLYRFFPLKGLHKNAVISGQAAYAAWKLGKYSEMKDKLLEKQPDWENLGDPKDTFVGYAQELGINAGKFIEIMNSEEAKNAVLKGEAEALGLNLNSTPTFFVGNKKMQASSYDNFKNLIDAELKNK